MPKQCESNGVTLNCELMPNGEHRYRMYFADASAYIRTVSSQDGSWQNSHYHTSICERTGLRLRPWKNKVNRRGLCSSLRRRCVLRGRGFTSCKILCIDYPSPMHKKQANA